jgi:hypothetical protein
MVTWGAFKNPDAQAIPRPIKSESPGIGIIFFNFSIYSKVQPRSRTTAVSSIKYLSSPPDW